MNADELESLFQASPCETETTAVASSRPRSPPPSFRATRFARFGVLADPASGEEARAASETISSALARRPLRVTATEWGAALAKAESFWHGVLRPRAEKFLSLPVGPRLRYHVWGETDDPDVVDVMLLHDLGEAGGGLSDLGVALARRGYRVWAPDFRGHGDSDRARPYDENALVEDLRAFVVELDLYRRPVVLVGFGLGACVALAFAATHPQLAGGLVLLDVDLADLTGPAGARGARYRFHPSQAATFPDVRAAVDRACAPELLELLSADAETPRGGFRRDATRALQRLRWAVRDEVSPAKHQVVTKMDDSWCFFAARDAKVRRRFPCFNASRFDRQRARRDTRTPTRARHYKSSNRRLPFPHRSIHKKRIASRARCPTRLVLGARSGAAARAAEDGVASFRSSLPERTDFASIAVPGAGARCLEDRPRETRDIVLDCVLAFEGPIATTDPASRRPELLGASVRALPSFDSVEQAKKFLCARAPPSAAAIEEALRDARQGDEADSEEDEETRAARVRTTALAKDDAGYFGFVG